MKLQEKTHKALHPFSAWKYFRNNKRRFMVITLTVLLGVFLLYTVSMVIRSMENAYKRASIEPKRYYSSLYARTGFIQKSTLDDLRSTGLVEKMIPLVEYGIPMRLNIGGTYYTPMIIVKRDEMIYLMERMHLKLIEGRLPQAGSLETILHEDVAKNLGVIIGERVGSGINNNAWFPEEYTVVGLVGGEAMVSFAHLNINDAQKYSVLLIPKHNDFTILNQHLEDMKSSKLTVSTYELESDIVNTTMASINLLLTAISLTVIIIISLSVGFLTYIYFIQRRSEYGLLWALGYTRQKVINRAFAEITLMNASGFVLGAVLSILAGIMLNAAFYSGMGQMLPIFNTDSLMKATCIPVFSSFFGLLPVWRMLKHYNSVNVLDTI